MVNIEPHELLAELARVTRGNMPGYEPSQQRDRRFSCPPGSCNVNEARAILAQATAAAEQAAADREAIRRHMTAALWCEVGDHSFSAKDKGQKEIVQRSIDPETGATVEESGTVCGAHAAPELAPLRKVGGRYDVSKLSPQDRAQMAKDLDVDPAYIAWLEQQTGVGQRQAIPGSVEPGPTGY